MTKEGTIKVLERLASYEDILNFIEEHSVSVQDSLYMAISALKKLGEIENIIGYASLYMNDIEKYNKIQKVVESND